MLWLKLFTEYSLLQRVQLYQIGSCLDFDLILHENKLDIICQKITQIIMHVKRELKIT